MNTRDLYAIHMGNCVAHNPTLIYTFPTSNGEKNDIYNLHILDSILNENIIIICFQTYDDICFYDQNIHDDEKILNLEQFLTDVEQVIKSTIEQYKTHKIPILLGCSMGGYYAQLLFMRNPNKFHCISLGGVCDLSILDKCANNIFVGDHVINYNNNKEIWDKYNPCQIPMTEKLHTKIISCFGMINDEDLIPNIVPFYTRINTWNYIKYYDLCHDFSSWRFMAHDIFKGNMPDFHDFRIDFYK
jgi:esterase/lipase superfamily enzyme